MTDPVSQVGAQVKTDVAAAETAVKADVAKQESWIKTNAKPLIIGLVVGAAIAFGLAHL